MKRRYYPNQEVTAKGFRLSVTTGGTVYQEIGGTLRRLSAIWLPKTRVLCVSLPNGEEARLQPTMKGIVVVEDKPAAEVVAP